MKPNKTMCYSDIVSGTPGVSTSVVVRTHCCALAAARRKRCSIFCGALQALPPAKPTTGGTRAVEKNVMITKIMGHLLKKTNIGTRNTMYLPDSRCIYQTVLVSTADRLYLPAAHLVSTRDAPCIYQRRSLYLPGIYRYLLYLPGAPGHNENLKKMKCFIGFA